jgi:protein TonB
MSHSAVLRATSLATSGALLAAIVIAAFSMSIVLRENPPPFDGPIFDFADPPVEPPARPTRPRVAPPPTTDMPQIPTDFTPVETPADFVDIDPGPVVDPLPMITRPQWVRRPSGLGPYYPRRALDRGITGEVQLTCVVTTAGALDCAVASETPAGWGFGDAAIRIARDHRMVPATRDGIPVEGRYVMRVPFRVD